MIALEIGKTYVRATGKVEVIMGATKENPEWYWALSGNWYEASTGRFLTYLKDGRHVTYENSYLNLIAEKK